MAFHETDEHRALRKTVAGIAGGFGPGYYAAKAAAGEPCAELWSALGEHGFVGIDLPAEYGGGDAGLVDLAMVCEETAAAGVPLLLLFVSAAISGEMIAEFGSPEQRARWLPRMASGESKVVLAITEPNARSGSPARRCASASPATCWTRPRPTLPPGSCGTPRSRPTRPWPTRWPSLATEYGFVPYWGLARLLQIAPVSREMILNFVAQHSLGLARSY